MARRLGIWLCLLAVVSFIAQPAFAAVQNVKVSGDISVSAVSRNNLDLDKTRALLITGATDSRNDEHAAFLSIARVRVDADLTDNVSTSVRLLNERNWNGDSSTATTGNNRNIGLATANAVATEKQTDLDLASITLKEFLYSPLTLTVGRQELRFGNGWIVGDPDTNGAALTSTLAEGDLSARKSFDALRARFDYNPLVLDLIYAKVAENNTVLNDDTDLYGINAAYELSPQTTIEGFYFAKKRGLAAAGGAIGVTATNLDSGLTTSFDNAVVKQKDDVVNTIGVRAVNKSVKNLTLDAQVAYQFGTYNPRLDPNARFITATDKALTSPRSAWGTEIVAAYDLKDVAAISKWEPSITGAYIYLSGESRDKTGSKAYKGWDPMFEDQTFGHLINAVMGFSNAHLFGVSLKAKPAADLTARLDYVTGWFAKKYAEGRFAILSGVSTAQTFTMSHKANFGHEFDATLAYDYTEDVQLSLLGGLFFPSKAINGDESIYPYRQKAAAAELIGSMKVTF